MKPWALLHISPFVRTSGRLLAIRAYLVIITAIVCSLDPIIEVVSLQLFECTTINEYRK
jgi:hypothetical protein